MGQRTCRVSFRDQTGVSHAVEVTAGSLFEAASMALESFRQHEWVAATVTPVTVLRVEVQQPAVAHDVTIEMLERWKRSPATSPRDFLSKRQPR